MIPLIIMGAGTFAIETLEIAEMAGSFQSLGFVVNLDPPPAGTTLAGLPIFNINNLPFTPSDCYLVAAIVSTRRRAFIEIMQARGYRFTTVVHPSAVISRRATIAPGCVVNAGVVVSPNTNIGEHVIVNRGSLIGHDNNIQPFCTLGPGVNLAGALEIGEGAYIGVGAIIRDHLTVGAESVIGAGAVVVNHVPSNVMVAGIPASVIKTGVKGL